MAQQSNREDRTVIEHPTTRDAAEWISVYDHMDWLADTTTVMDLHTSTTDPAGHLEEIARAAAVVHQLDGRQGVRIHRAVLAGASLMRLAEALGEPPAGVVDRYRRWSDGQRHVELASCSAAEHDQVAAVLANQLAADNI